MSDESAGLVKQGTVLCLTPPPIYITLLVSPCLYHPACITLFETEKWDREPSPVPFFYGSCVPRAPLISRIRSIMRVCSVPDAGVGW